MKTKMKIFPVLFILISLLASCDNSDAVDLERLEKEMRAENQERYLVEQKIVAQKIDDSELAKIKMGQSDLDSLSNKIIETTSNENLREKYLKEISDPVSHLRVSYSFGSRSLTGQDNIKGWVRSSADKTKYKDIILTVTYLSHTDEELERRNFLMKDKLSPKASVDFKIKAISPDGTENAVVTVKSANIDLEE